MATKKAGGSSKNMRDSNPKYLGVKLNDGATAKPGAIIIRQRGTNFIAGMGTDMGKDHTIFSLKDGIVAFRNKRKMNFDGSYSTKKLVSVK